MSQHPLLHLSMTQMHLTLPHRMHRRAHQLQQHHVRVLRRAKRQPLRHPQRQQQVALALHGAADSIRQLPPRQLLQQLLLPVP